MIKRTTYRFFGVAVLMLFMTLNVLAQDGYKSEDEMIKAAASFYEEEQYDKSMPLYSQLVSLYPKNLEYNMKYGVSLLHADPDKSKCLKYLKYASSKNESEAISHYHYGYGLHLNYDFNKAVKHYQKFQSNGSKKELAQYSVDRKIEMAKNGKNLLSGVFDLNVIEKKEISRSEFFRIYDLGEIGGKIIVKPDEFKSKLDIKENEFSLIHLPGEADIIYYSSYGTDKTRGKDIFRVRKQGDGWSEPENLGGVVNTPYDEDYPFMHPNGTLYFASKGHNSMGGYDLFKSSYNESTGTWSKPENLNFAISSTFDDILFISDIKGQLAYFASARSTVDGKVNVYRVQINRKPFDNAFLAGSFINEGSDENKAAKITIYDLEDNSKVGTYYTNEETGKYNIKLPKSGQAYKFVVETDEDSPVHTGKVEIPEQSELVSLKQEIRLVGTGDSEKLVIKNLFDETTALEPASMVSLLQSSSDLQVNATEAEVLQNIDDAPSTDAPSASVKDIPTQHAALIADMETLIVDTKKESNILQNQIAFGFRYSFDKAVQADQLYDQLEVTRQAMINESDAGKKKQLTDDLIEQRKKLDPIASDAIVSFDFTKSLANEYDEKLNDLDRLNKNVATFKSAERANSEEDMKADIDQYGPMIEDLKSMKSAFEIAPQRYKDLLVSTNEKLKKEEKYYNEVKSDIEGINLEISDIEKRISDTKSKKAVEQLNAEKSTKEIDLQDLEYEFSGVKKKYGQLKKDKKNLESDARQINSFIDKMAANTASVNQLNNDDQAELNKLIDFLKEQRLLEDVIGEEELTAFMTEDKKTEDLSSAQKYSATDNNGNSVNYDELYAVNLAAIELVSDDQQRYEQSADLYDNWASTVAEDKSIQENQLNFTEKKGDKQVIEEKIKILDKKEKEYEQLASDFREKAELAATGQVAVTDAKTDSPSGGQKGGTSAGGATVSADAPVSVGALIASAAVVKSTRGKSSNDINEAYQEAIDDLEKKSDDPTYSMQLAAFELKWASSLDDLIEQKEKQLETETDPEVIQELEREIAEMKAERDKHLVAASSEFTEVEMSFHSGKQTVEENNEFYIPFDPEKGMDQDYDAQYQALVDAVENHQILTEDQKNKELSLIHNYWSRTIQEEIFWLEKEKGKLKSQAELNEIDNRIIDLTSDKKVHINLSNEYYRKYKQSQQYSEDLAELEKKEASSGTTAGAAITAASSYGEFAEVYRKYKADNEAKYAALENDMSQVSDKGEKQQIALSMALLKRQADDQAKAEEELSGKGGDTFLNSEVKEDMTEAVPNWNAQADDYVFAKKDFSVNAPASGAALSAFKEAQQNYNEVQSLERQKEALLASSDFDKEAEAKLMELQDRIEAKKLETYQSLLKANKISFESNREEIKAMIESNPALQNENPALIRRYNAANVIYEEVEQYVANAESFESVSLKFDVYDQAQFMSEYVLSEQTTILEELESTAYTGELAFLNPAVKESANFESQLSEFKINRAEYEALVQNPFYQEYEKDQKALVQMREERQVLEADVIDQESKLAELRDERNFLLETAATAKKSQKKKLVKEAEVITEQIEAEEKRLDSLNLALTQEKEKENNVQGNSQRILRQASVEDRYKYVMVAELRIRGADENQFLTDELVASAPREEVRTFESETPTETSIETAGTPAGGSTTGFGAGVAVAAAGTYAVEMNANEFKTLGTEIPKELDGDLFITAPTTTVSPYNERKPIPIDEDIPTGLVFKVQIGAYRNPIPQDLFKGFAPLMGEKIPSGITRYTAGLFRDFGNANKAKNEIRQMGYSDAFVVAFLDGKRIPFSELADLENFDLDNARNVSDETIGGVPVEVFTTPSIIDDEGEVSSAIAVQTVNTKEVKGVFFTVQVGVYTNTVVPERLKVFREMNSELLDNGNVRYTVGQFPTADAARLRQSDVQSVVQDAFITAYNNGVRISVAEALRIQGQ